MLTGLVLGEAVAWLGGEKGIYMMALFLLTALGWYFFHGQKQGHFRDRRFGFALMAGFAFFGGICFFADASLPEWKEEKCTVAGRVISVREKDQGKLQLVLDQVTPFREVETAGKEAHSRIHFLVKGKDYTGKIQVYYTPSQAIRILPGDRVQISGELLPLSGPTNKGEFDSRTWYQAQGIRSLFFGQSLEIINRPAISIRAVAWGIKERIGAIYRQVLNPEDAALLTAMALGDKSGLSEEQRQTFAENGVAHLLAVSGLHVSILGGFLYRLLKKRGAGYLLSCLAAMWAP